MAQYLTEIANWGQLNQPNLKYRGKAQFKWIFGDFLALFNIR